MAALDRLGRVGCDRHEHLQELVIGAAARFGLVDRDHPETPPVTAVEGHEQRIVGPPRRRVVLRLELGRVRRDVRVPLESLGGDEERAVAQEARVEHRRPRLGRRDVAEQDLSRALWAEHGLDLELILFGPIEVDHDSAEAERVGHDLGDRGKQFGQLATGAHEPCQLE